MGRRSLGVCLDHIALLRQARRSDVPDPVEAAAVAENAGADLVVVHLRDDRLHIQERDLRLLRQTVKTALSLRITTTQEMLKLVYDIKPDHVTLVPEHRDEVTTLSGFDIAQRREHLRKYVQGLRDGDIPVSVLIDPDIDQVRAAHRLDINAVVFDTSKFAAAPATDTRETQRLVDAAQAAGKLNMHVTVAQGLNIHNVRRLVDFDAIRRYEVGHSIVARSVVSGLDTAVRDMIAALTA